MSIIPNLDLCRGYMLYGLGAHVVYANLNAAQIHKKMLKMTAVVLILKANIPATSVSEPFRPKSSSLIHMQQG